jgi:hypothetical protein
VGVSLGVRYPCIRSAREVFIDNLLVQILYIILMIRWTGLAPWEFEFPLPGSLLSTFLVLYSLRCYRTEVSWLPEKSSLPSGENASEFSSCGRAARKLTCYS